MSRTLRAAALAALLAVALTPARPAAQVDDRLSERVTEAEEAEEHALTGLLNRLARGGFADLRAVRRDGDAYVVEAMDRDLQVRRFRLDPQAGSVTEIP
jgi:hypothetical protein